jgi:type III restriction enzyme
MLELKAFQAESAKLIVDRYAFFVGHPYRPTRKGKPLPFFQGLSALTGAGKTPILAQAVALLRAHFASEPIVFWMSKAKSVVAQTYNNFSAGGKYSEIIEGFRVITVPQLTPKLIDDGTSPLLIMATTGLFNNKDQAEGSLNIYQKDEDQFGDKSPWERLKERLHEGKPRPLLIVYDEGHNLSEQQTDILSELEPDAYLLASATLRLPENFRRNVLRPVDSWVDQADGDDDVTAFGALHAIDPEEGKPSAELFITTMVPSEKVVDSELVKKSIHFDGTTAQMEFCLDELVARMDSLEAEIKTKGPAIRPKAFYVSNTNMVGKDEKDNPGDKFEHRKAPPIRIWRYLVEKKGVNPEDIAIYSNLAFENNKPKEVNLFSKGDNDFDKFTAGDFKHIIFNQALQEGWDDPECYCAYIDKSMGSSVQVEQIIGRALRQPGAKHYDSPLLNTAHFFLRVDKESVFTDAINKVRARLKAEGAPIDIVESYGGKGSGSDEIWPKDDVEAPLCHVNVDATDACAKIAEIVAEFPVFKEGDENTVAQARAASEIMDLKKLGTGGAPDPQWVAKGNTNPVRLRWLASLALKARSNRAYAVTDLKDHKFDVKVQLQSTANKLAESTASKIVEAYFQHADLVYETVHPFEFGPIRVQKSAPAFDNALYERYSGLNKLELPCAYAIDKTKNTWHRNPSSGGFAIPLLTEGDTGSFYPDFIVWKGEKIFCIDTKGGHLLSDAVARKLFDIYEGGKVKLQVRFITEGKQKKLMEKPIKGGFTVWKIKSGNPTPIHVATMGDAVKECLK